MNKEEYRSNRNKGLRGQGPHPSVVVGYTTPDKVVQGAVGSRRKPQRASRR